MLSYLFMKALEGRPRSYDRRMDRLSGGRVAEVKRAVAAAVHAGDRVLEVGCGTGELAAMAVARGATVLGIDASPAMVEVARSRAAELEGRLEIEHMGVEAMDTLQAASFDVVLATLVLSELSEDERAWTLGHAHRVLTPGGRLVVADEVVPRATTGRMAQAAVRLPMLAAAYLVARSITRPVPDLAGEVRSAGFEVDEEQRSQGDAFATVYAHRPEEAA